MSQVLSQTDRENSSADCDMSAVGVYEKLSETVFPSVATWAYSVVATAILFWLCFSDASIGIRLTEEDGLFENLTAIVFAGSAMLCVLALLIRRSGHPAYLVLWLLLTVVFCGEEISWGQRIFGFGTPEVFSDNVQGEANLHNLGFWTPKVVSGPKDLVTSQGLFYLGFGMYFLAIPVMFALKPLKRVRDKFNIPVPKTSLVVAIWIPIIISFVLASMISYGPHRDALTETRELCFACSILLYVLWFGFYMPPARTSRGL